MIGYGFYILLGRFFLFVVLYIRTQCLTFVYCSKAQQTTE